MRAYGLLGALAGATVLVALTFRHNPPPAPEHVDPATVAAVPVRENEARIPTAPSSVEALAETPPLPTQSAVVAAAAPPAAAEPTAVEPAVPPRLPQLPERTIAARPARAVPDDEPPLPRPVEVHRSPSLGAPGSDRRGIASGSTHEPSRAALQLPPRAPTPRDTARPIQITGAAEPSGATALRVAGKPLRLFGVRPPANGDRCSPSALGAKPLPCADQASKLLAARLARNAGVSCRVPAPSRAADAAICLDADGVDLGGLLVAEGLAVADPSQSYDYVGAESVARSNRRGLWLFR